MLDSMRQAASGWTAKVLLGLLVLSFAVWGISGQFFGYGTGTVATVGKSEVTAISFDRALRQRMLALGQQLQRGVSLEQARALGIPEQVLAELVSQATLDDQARLFNLGVSEDTLAKEIAANPNFQGVGGSFDRARFQAVLRNAGTTEAAYIRDLKGTIVRRQLAGAIAGDITAPRPLTEALYRYQTETRTISFVTVGENAIEAVGEPDDAALTTYFDQNKGRFRAPEYRTLGIIMIDPASVADPDAVTAEQVRAVYDERSSEFTKAERRKIQQIRYENEDAARAAMSLAETGTDIVELAKANNLTGRDIDLGLKAKAEIVDIAVAEAAFKAPVDQVVAVYDGTLGPALIRVSEIQAGSVTPFSDVRDRLRREIAEQTAGEKVLDLFDAIEDERAGGSTLAEITAKLNLDYQKVDAVAADGSAPDGTAITGLPEQEALLIDAFQSDIGVENDALRSGSEGYVFYEVLDITDDRDRSLEEARSDVVAAWRAEEISARIGARAEELLDRLKAGAELAAVASGIGRQVKVATDVTRSGDAKGLSANAVAQAFAGPEGHLANAEADDGPQRLIVRVDAVSAPAFFAESQDAEFITTRLGQAMQNDILQAYNGHLLNQRKTTVNSAVYLQITGQTQSR
jgi:peptidyl-prolyl cis-trans isomerase D